MVESSNAIVSTVSTDIVGQMTEVIVYLDNKSARGEALKVILGYTSTDEHRAMFVGKELTKRCLRLVIEPDM